MEESDDDLRPEYDLTKMKVRRLGKGRSIHQVPLDENDDLRPHYDLDYSKAKPNRFAEAYKKGVKIRIIRQEEGDSDETIASRESE